LVIRVLLDTFDGFDLFEVRRSIQLNRHSGKASPRETHSIRDVGEIDKAALFLLERIDQFDISVFAKVLAKLLIGIKLVIFDVADVDVARSSGLYDHCDTGRGRTRRLSL
jgi:hypothetical protein